MSRRVMTTEQQIQEVTLIWREYSSSRLVPPSGTVKIADRHLDSLRETDISPEKDRLNTECAGQESSSPASKITPSHESWSPTKARVSFEPNYLSVPSVVNESRALTTLEGCE
jgi:hypothetical protein